MNRNLYNIYEEILDMLTDETNAASGDFLDVNSVNMALMEIQRRLDGCEGMQKRMQKRDGS